MFKDPFVGCGKVANIKLNNVLKYRSLKWIYILINKKKNKNKQTKQLNWF